MNMERAKGAAADQRDANVAQIEVKGFVLADERAAVPLLPLAFPLSRLRERGKAERAGRVTRRAF